MRHPLDHDQIFSASAISSPIGSPSLIHSETDTHCTLRNLITRLNKFAVEVYFTLLVIIAARPFCMQTLRWSSKSRYSLQMTEAQTNPFAFADCTDDE